MRAGAVILAFAFLFCGRTASAHPGVGIVSDSRGNVFFTDLAQVWRIAPDGKKSVVVPKVHTHELVLDADDNLYGEHLWYEGDRTGKWGHRVWKLSAQGVVSDVYPAREGFLTDYSFVRDGAGNMYWAERGAATRIRRRAPGGQMSDVSSGDLGDVRWMAASREGVVYLVSYRGAAGHDLLRITAQGRIETVARKVSTAHFWSAFFDGRHDVMGLAPDKNGNVYVAVAANRVVKKIAPDGKVTVAARSTLPWSPSGVLPTSRGELWVLEYNPANMVRVRRIRPDGSGQTF